MPIQQAQGAEGWTKFLALVPTERLNTPVSPAVAQTSVDTSDPVASPDSYRPTVIEEAPQMPAAAPQSALSPDTIAYIANSQRETEEYVRSRQMSSHYERSAVVAGQTQRYEYINGSANRLGPGASSYQDPSLMGNYDPRLQQSPWLQQGQYSQGVFGQGNFAPGNVPVDRFGQPIISPAIGGFVDPTRGQFVPGGGQYPYNNGIYDPNNSFGQNWNLIR